jgi:hypothetical protein
MGVNLPFKNVILSMDKIESINGEAKEVQLTSYNYTDWKEIYRNKLLALVFNLGEEGKEIYQGEHGLSSGEL